MLWLACLCLLRAAQPDIQSIVGVSPSHEVMQLPQAERCRALGMAERWLGVGIPDHTLRSATRVTTTDGRWAFSSYVTANDPAWLVEVDRVVFELGVGREMLPLDLIVLLRPRDGALLGVRTKWPHQDKGVDVYPMLEGDFRATLAGGSLCWSGVGVEAQSTLLEVLQSISAGFGGPASAESITAYVVDPLEVCPGGANICARPELGPTWAVEVCCLAKGNSVVFGMDRRAPGVTKIVSHAWHIVYDGPRAGFCVSTSPNPVVTIMTADGTIEARNWFDGTHAPPHGLAAPAHDSPEDDSARSDR
jgi:hypothetical protein